MIREKSSRFATSFFLGILLVAATFFVFCSKVADWRWFDDDYGAIYTATNTPAKDIGSFFSTNHNDKTILASNEIDSYKETSGTTFRPLTLVWYWVVARLLNSDNPQGFFNFSIFLHLVVVLLLFVAFQGYLSTELSFWAALIFSIFPFCGKFLGRFVIQPYSLSLILHLLGYFAVTRGRNIGRVVGVALFFSTLLLHEINISFVCFYLFIFLAKYWGRKRVFCQSVTLALRDCTPFFVSVVVYFLAKMHAYPQAEVALGLAQTFQVLFHKMQYRFYDFVTLVVDVHGLSFIAGGHPFFKTGLLFVDGLLVGGLFYFGRNLLTLGLWLLFVIQCWPSFLVMHVSRYLYFGLPFFILSLFVAYQKLGHSKREKTLKLLLCVRYFSILFAGVVAIPKDLKNLEKKFVFSDDAMRDLAEKVGRLDVESLSVFGAPFDSFPVSGFAQAIWFYTSNNKIRVFYDQLHTIRFSQYNVRPVGDFCQVFVDREDCRVQIKCGDVLGAHILVATPFGGVINYSMGSYESDQNRLAKSVSFQIKEGCFPDQFVLWDNVLEQFIVHKNPQVFCEKKLGRNFK